MNIKDYYLLRKKVLEKIYFQRDIDFIKIDKRFIKEIEEYFKQAEADEKTIEKLRKKDNLAPETSFEYFRAMERIEIRKKIIQTLLAILLKKAPEPKNNPVFLQLSELSEELISLFDEDDVYESMLREYLHSDFLKKHIYDFKEFYDFNLNEIKNNIKNGKEKKDFSLILEALFLNSVFWFTIREGVLDKIRKSDLYIYLLSKKLKEKYEKS